MLEALPARSAFGHGDDQSGRPSCAVDELLSCSVPIELLGPARSQVAVRHYFQICV